MANEHFFGEVPEADVPFLLNDLEEDIPSSLQALGLLKNIHKWRASDFFQEAKLLALNSDYRTKIIIFYTLSSDGQFLRVLVYKWTHQEDDIAVMVEALKKTKETIPWYLPRVILAGLNPESFAVVMPAMAEIWKTNRYVVESQDSLYWVPKEEVLGWNIKIPDGTKLSYLNETHIDEILESWPWANQEGKDFFRATLQVNCGLGLFDCATGELMSWAMHKYYGDVGVLHTKHHRKREADPTAEESTDDLMIHE